MMSFLKFILVAIVAQFVSAAAFVSNGSHSTAYRSVQQGLSPTLSTTTQLKMAVAAPAPAKKKEKKVVDESDNQSEQEKDRGWLVRLYNDPMNKREFVARCLMEICGLDDGMAYNVMMKAHQTGISVIGNYHRELAELYKARLLGEGLLIDMVPADDE